MSDIENKNKIEPIDVTAEPGVIAERYESGSMVTRENLMAFVIWSFYQARGGIDRQTQALTLALAKGLVTLETLEAIIKKLYEPIDDELEIAHKAFIGIKAHNIKGNEDTRYVYGEILGQLSLAVERIKH